MKILDWGCVILREIDFLLKICWSIPCLHPSWKVHTCWYVVWRIYGDSLSDLSFYCSAVALTVSNWVLCARQCHTPLSGREILSQLLVCRGMPARYFESDGRLGLQLICFYENALCPARGFIALQGGFKREVCSESMTKFSSIQFFVRNVTISR